MTRHCSAPRLWWWLTSWSPQETRESGMKQECWALLGVWKSWLWTRFWITDMKTGYILSSRTALGKQDSFFSRGSPEHFSSFSYPLLPTDVSEGDLFRRDVLFGALFFGHCLLRVIIQVELITFPSTCNHLPYGGLMWKDSSPWGIYSRRHPALLKGRVAEWLRGGALL